MQEVYYTSKYGSWLNLAEIELSAVARQCLNWHIPNPETLQRELTAWERHRNSQRCTID
ncbi:MAG: hypothetical protein J7641_04110 [Cyanobacteria bacterium SID2]|nr:hypothetical protein [Cyanobacteria bacterium SID2]MBP0002749.1 hypothetical protein [Cyanobacteria bacterium SBC]